MSTRKELTLLPSFFFISSSQIPIPLSSPGLPISPDTQKRTWICTFMNPHCIYTSILQSGQFYVAGCFFFFTTFFVVYGMGPYIYTHKRVCVLCTLTGVCTLQALTWKHFMQFLLGKKFRKFISLRWNKAPLQGEYMTSLEICWSLRMLNHKRERSSRRSK